MALLKRASLEEFYLMAPEVQPDSWSLRPWSWRPAQRLSRSSQTSPGKECPTGRRIPAKKCQNLKKTVSQKLFLFSFYVSSKEIQWPSKYWTWSGIQMVWLANGGLKTGLIPLHNAAPVKIRSPTFRAYHLLMMSWASQPSPWLGDNRTCSTIPFSL